MEFLNRAEEMKLLNKVASSKLGGLVVIWGRRRVGKTRLLLEWAKKLNGIYWVADESSPKIQMHYFARSLDASFPGFSRVQYNHWNELFDRIAQEAKYTNWRGPLIIDEFPYLVSASKELPSIIQRWVDHQAKDAKITLVLSGSSQRMMQGLVLNDNAPLYGRARELFKLNPLLAGYLSEALLLKSSRKIVESYSLWGGVPRYLELASEYKDSLLEAANELVLNPSGVLHQEPHRLLLDEMPSAMPLRPILDAIGSGAHRLSEIGSRVGQSATSLSHSLTRLRELDLVQREIPFGESEKSSKRSLYKIKDPFFRFWFDVVAPRRSLLAESDGKYRIGLLKKHLPELASITWEQMCLAYVSRTRSLAKVSRWVESGRYWMGKGPEWDVVAKCENDKNLLLGEAKWPRRPVTSKYIQDVLCELKSKGLPPLKNIAKYKIKYCLFLPELPDTIEKLDKDLLLVDACAVLKELK